MVTTSIRIPETSIRNLSILVKVGKSPFMAYEPFLPKSANDNGGDPNFGKQNWQVEIFKFGDYIWINQARHLVFLH